MLLLLSLTGLSSHWFDLQASDATLQICASITVFELNCNVVGLFEYAYMFKSDLTTPTQPW